MKNQIAALAGKVVELNKTIESQKNKYQKSTEKCDDIQTQLDDVRKENRELLNDNQRLQEISDRYDRVVRILGSETVEDVVQQDIKEQRTLEEKRRMEQMPKGSVLKQLEWATQKSQIENQQRKKNRTKYKGLEIQTMKKQIYDEKNGMSYTLHGDYYLPDLVLREEEPTYGKYGMLRKQFLKEHRSARYQYLLLTGKLNEHLNQTDQEAREQVETLMEQMTEKQGVTEELKAQDQMEWVRLMNNIKASAEEIVLKNMIYV